MLTLFFIIFVLMVFISVATSASRRRRRAREANSRREEEARAGGGDPFSGASPFEMLPFGGLLESLMTGMGARSFRYDEESGQWVEISDEIPAQQSAPDLESDTLTADPTAARRRRRTRTQARSLSTGPFGGLMGSLGGARA